jgi:hypothetical protein
MESLLGCSEGGTFRVSFPVVLVATAFVASAFLTFGAVLAFFAGRFWSDSHSSPELSGEDSDLFFF